MTAMVRNKFVLLILSPLLLLGVIYGAAWLFEFAMLPQEAETSRNSFIILGLVHFFTLSAFLKVGERSIRHANHQIIWLFLGFIFCAILTVFTLRLSYSNAVLLSGAPLSLILLLIHQRDLAAQNEARLFILPNPKLADSLNQLGLSFEIVTLSALATLEGGRKQSGLLLISEEETSLDYYRLARGFNMPKTMKITMAERYIEHYRGAIDTLSLGDLAKAAHGFSNYQLFKRFIEIAISLVIICLTSPLLLATYLLIKTTSPGPVIFKQERVGLDSKSFTIFKFRTMHLDSEVGGQQFASQDDPRIIKYGNFLRKSRIDELPQIWNVLRGDMSLIGPRPEQRDLFDALCADIPQFALRQLVRPGITGWAQTVQGYAYDEDSSRIKLSHDLYYIRHIGPTLDLLIIARTLTTILTGFGSR